MKEEKEFKDKEFWQAKREERIFTRDNPKNDKDFYWMERTRKQGFFSRLFGRDQDNHHW